MNTSTVSTMSPTTAMTTAKAASVNSLTYAVAVYLSIEMTLACALGLVGNCVIMITMPFAKLAKKTRILLCSLAFADFLALLTNGVIKIAIPQYYVMTQGFKAGPNIANDLSCKWTHYLMDVSEVASQFMTAILAAERCYVVYFPLKAANLTTRTTTIAVLVGYILCLLGTIPQLFYYGIANSVCTAAHTDMNTADMYMLMRHLVIEHIFFNLVIAVCNIFILSALSRRQKQQQQLIKGDTSDKKSNLRVTIALVVSSSVHAVLFTPCGVACYLQYYYANSATLVGYMTLGVNFSYSIYVVTHGLNFVVYMLTIPAFRDTVLCKK